MSSRFSVTAPGNVSVRSNPWLLFSITLSV
jgi:hypothetical protein